MPVDTVLLNETEQIRVLNTVLQLFGGVCREKAREVTFSLLIGALTVGHLKDTGRTEAIDVLVIVVASLGYRKATHQKSHFDYDERDF